MSSSGSVTHWLQLLKAGDSAAAQPLWERYFHRLVGFARTKLQGLPRRAADEEDVALSAFHSLCRAAEQGRFPRLDDRNDLSQLLVLLTARKALRLLKHERRQKRGGGRVLGEADLEAAGDDEAGLAQVIGDEPTPEFAAQVAEECRRLLDLLGDEQLQALAVARMEGCTTEELAARHGVAPRTIERKLQKIRELWAQEASP
jgi:DNA-directed RNA polymerase specialized sigma24 family protein